MAVKKYSVKKSGDARLSGNFRVKEFASHDGADAVYIDDDLVYLLQGIRNHFRRPVVITSGYRTAAYNKAIGGSTGSNHTKGLAADIQVRGVHPVLVAMYAEELRAGGIGLYAYSDGGFCHIDTRAVKYRWLATVRGGKNEQVSRQLPALKIGGASNTFNSVSLLQRTLGVSQFGFDIAEDVSGGDVIQDDFDVDKAIEEIDEPTAKRGDIWTLGNHRLICGDCTDRADVSKLMQGNFADMVITDPPYNMAYEGAGGTSDAKRKSNRIMNDKMSSANFEKFLSGFYASLFDTIKEHGTFYVFYKELGEGVFISELKKSGLNFKQELVWVKNQLVLGGQKYQNMYEPILFGYKGKTPATWNGKRNQTSVIEDINLMNEIELREALRELIATLETDVIRERKPLKNDLHPTMKPIKLLAKFIRNSSNTSDIVLDFFGGSGSTLIACEQLNRRCCTMELDPKYCDVIIKRWEQLTGKKAILN